MTKLNNYVDKLISKELSQDTSNKMISKIDKDVNFKLNSFNICIGKQSTGKTTSVLKELIKLSLKQKDLYHLIVCVSNNSSDNTFNGLYKYIDIPIVKTDYEHLDEQFNALIKLKDAYNKMVDGELAEDPEILDALYVKDFSQ